MANPSKRYPFVVEVHVKSIEQWISMGAFKYLDEATSNMNLYKSRVPEGSFRVRDFRTDEVLLVTQEVSL